MNRKTMGIIRAAADVNSNRTLWSDSLAKGQPATLLGAPVYEAVDMADFPAATGTAYPIAFGDFSSGYQIIDRIGTQILRDDYTGASTGVVNFHGRRRVGGKPLLAEATVLVSSTHA
jgi:HK97 family phage major capsid protein